MTVAHLSILETQDHNSVRLRLNGELDIASVPLLDARLSQLRTGRRAVHLDLSELEFIDSSGLHALIRAVQSAGDDGWDLQIDRRVSPSVRRVFQIVQFQRLIPGLGTETVVRGRLDGG